MSKLYDSPHSPFDCDSDSNTSLAPTPTCSTTNGSNHHSDIKNDHSNSDNHNQDCDSGGYYSNTTKSTSCGHDTKSDDCDTCKNTTTCGHDSKSDTCEPCKNTTTCGHDTKSDTCEPCKDTTTCDCTDTTTCGHHSKSDTCEPCKNTTSCGCTDTSTCGCDHSKSNSCGGCADTSSCGCDHSKSTSCGCCTDTTDCNCTDTTCCTDTTDCDPTEYYPSDYCSTSVGPRECPETPQLPISECEPLIPPMTDNDNIACKPCEKEPCNGKFAQNFGYCTEASGFAAFAEGCNTSAQGACSHAEGRDTVAADEAAHAEGHKTLAWGKASHAEGRDTKAVGNHSHAEGGPDFMDVLDQFAKGPVANGRNSHAEGAATVANGRNSHAEGLGAQAGDDLEPCPQEPSQNGLAAHAEGVFTLATGIGAHAEGGTTLNVLNPEPKTTASGDFSHAEGSSTLAAGKASHVEGSHNVVSSYSGHVEGENNVDNGLSISHVEGANNRTNPGLSGQHLTGFFGVFATDPRPDVNAINNTYNYSNQLASGQPGNSYPGEGISVIHKTSTAGVLYHQQQDCDDVVVINQQTNGIYPLGQQAAYRTLADGQNYAILLEDGGILPDDPIGIFVSFDIYNKNSECVGRVVAAEKTEHVIGVITGDAGFIVNTGEFPASERIAYDDYHRPLVGDSCATSAARHLSLLNINTTVAMKVELKKDDNTIYERLAKHITAVDKRTRFLAMGPNATAEIKEQAASLRAKEKDTAVHEPKMRTSVMVYDPKTGMRSEVEVKNLVHRKKEITHANKRNMDVRHNIEENGNGGDYPAKVTIPEFESGDNTCGPVGRSVPYVPRMLRTSPRWFQVAVRGLVVARQDGTCQAGHQCNVSNGVAYCGDTYWVVRVIDETKIVVWMR